MNNFLTKLAAKLPETLYTITDNETDKNLGLITDKRVYTMFFESEEACEHYISHLDYHLDYEIIEETVDTFEWIDILLNEKYAWVALGDDQTIFKFNKFNV